MVQDGAEQSIGPPDPKCDISERFLKKFSLKNLQTIEKHAVLLGM